MIHLPRSGSSALMAHMRIAALVITATLVNGCISANLGQLQIINARVNPQSDSLEMLVAREFSYAVEDLMPTKVRVANYALYAINVPAIDRSGDWNSWKAHSRKILSLNGPPPKDADFHYAAGTLFTQKSTELQWCTMQAGDSCKQVGEVTLKHHGERVAYDRDGQHFFVADQLFTTKLAHPLLKLTGRPGYQRFLALQLDRPLLVARRWLLSAARNSKPAGVPILHIYDLEHDTVETVLSRSFHPNGAPELMAVDRDTQGWRLLIQQLDCKEVSNKLTCVAHYAEQRPDQSQLVPLKITQNLSFRGNLMMDYGHWDAKNKQVWLFDSINRYDKAHGLAVSAARY